MKIPALDLGKYRTTLCRYGTDGPTAGWVYDTLGQADASTRLVQTIPGVGPRLAEAIGPAMDDPHRFAGGGQVASYAGLMPRQFPSGTAARIEG